MAGCSHALGTGRVMMWLGLVPDTGQGPNHLGIFYGLRKYSSAEGDRKQGREGGGGGRINGKLSLLNPFNNLIYIGKDIHAW